MSEKSRYVCLDNLPKVTTPGANKGGIDWVLSPGYTVKFKYDDIEGEIDILSYDKETTKVKLKYLEFEQDMGRYSFTNCKIANLIGVKTVRYLYNVGDKIIDDKRELLILKQIRIKYDHNISKNYVYEIKGYECECLRCGDISTKREDVLKRGGGCAVCNGNSSHKVIKDVNSVYKTNPEILKYFVNKEDAYNCSKGMRKPFLLKCPDCGTIRDDLLIPDLIRHGIMCRKCNDGLSVPNKFMFNILQQLNIKFEAEKAFEWCNYEYKNKIRRCRYDFYFELEGKHYLIEMDGGHHKKGRNGTSLEEQQFIDNTKDELAKNNNMKIIRIDCEFTDLELMKSNIIESKLNDLFDLNIIDFNKCFVQAKSTSLIKTICSLWMDIADCSTLAKKFSIEIRTIRKYLQLGKELGWCNYDAEVEKREAMLIRIKKKSKKVAIFKGEVKVYEFDSIAQTSRESVNFLGKYICRDTVSTLCNKDELLYSDLYDGFVFKFVV